MGKITICLVIIFCTFIFGQEASKDEESKNSIEKGSRAMVFEFSGLSYLGANSYNGGIAGKYFINNKMAIRAGIRFELYSETNPSNPPDGWNGKDGEYSSTNIGLFAILEYHFAPKKYISPYFGGGLGYFMFSDEDKEMDWYIPDSDAFRQVEEISGRNTFQFAGLIGAEVFIIKEISLSAEYLFYLDLENLGEEKTRYETISGNPTLPDSETRELGSSTLLNTESAGRIILSIYF